MAPVQAVTAKASPNETVDVQVDDVRGQVQVDSVLRDIQTARPVSRVRCFVHPCTESRIEARVRHRACLQASWYLVEIDLGKGESNQRAPAGFGEPPPF